MTTLHRCRVTSAAAGWIDAEDGSRETLATIDRFVTPDDFPGRWSPLRAFPEELDPLPAVVGAALVSAHAWAPGAKTIVAGGLVVGADGAHVAASVRFARHITAGFSAQCSPADFIHALPSTAASLLTKLYGFPDYQSTMIDGAESGARALGHAVDLMSTGRLETACVAVSSVARTERAWVRLAVALYLQPLERTTGVPVELGVPHRLPSADGPDDVLARRLRGFDALAALPLVRLAAAIASQREDAGHPFDVRFLCDT